MSSSAAMMTEESINPITFDDFLYMWLPKHSPYGATLIRVDITALKTGQIVVMAFTKTNSMGFQTSVHRYDDDKNLPCVKGLKTGKFTYDNNRKSLIVKLLTLED